MAEICPHCGKAINYTALNAGGGPQHVPGQPEEKQVTALEGRPVKQDRGDSVRQGLPKLRRKINESCFSGRTRRLQ